LLLQKSGAIRAVFRETRTSVTANDAIERTIPSLRRYARALLGTTQDADDLVHDALVDALARPRDGLEAAHIRPWLFAILRNRFVSNHRRAKYRATASSEDNTIERATVRPGQEAGLQMRDLTLGLAGLPVEQREVLLLVTVEGFSYADVAAMLDIPLGTVMSRLSRARDRLNDFMDGTTKPRLRSVS